MLEHQHKNFFINDDSQPPEHLVSLLFDLIEIVFSKEVPSVSISRTNFENRFILEIFTERSFINFIYDSSKLNGEGRPEEIILEYTGMELNPIKGIIKSENTFQGTIEKFYLVDSTWYYLNPLDYKEFVDPQKLIVDEKFFKEKIICELF